jgi:peptidoglycan/LPS O-acetylase OafA/YrhL
LTAPFVVARGAGDAPRLVGTGAASLLLVQSWHPPTIGVWVWPAWSLSVEVFLYALFPFLVGIARKVVRVRSAAVLAALCALVAPLAYLAASPLMTGESAARWMGVVRTLPPFFVPAFLLGIFLGLDYDRRPRTGSRRGFALSSLGIAGVLSCLVFSDHIPPVLNNALVLPFFGVAIYGLALGGGPIAWLLSRQPLQTLGEASYAVYILQVPVYLWCLTINKRLVSHFLFVPERWVYGISVVVIVIAALIVCRWFERPARRRVQDFFKARLGARRFAAAPRPSVAP